MSLPSLTKLKAKKSNFLRTAYSTQRWSFSVSAGTESSVSGKLTPFAEVNKLPSTTLHNRVALSPLPFLETHFNSIFPSSSNIRWPIFISSIKGG